MRALLPSTLFVLTNLALCLATPATVTGRTEPVEGLRDNTPAVHAFTGARIVVAPGKVVETGTLVIRNGIIEAAGEDVAPPADARLWDLEGKTIYPGFIDAHSRVGQQNPREKLDRGPVAWNPQVRAMLDAAVEYDPEKDGSEALREQGFTAALTVPSLGIFRGNAAAVSLSDEATRDRILRSGVAQSVSLTRSTAAGSGYPTSAMGGVALIRQTLYDADWHKRAHAAFQKDPAGLERPEMNGALAALAAAARGDQPLLFEARDDDELLRALRIADEFPVTPWIRGSGHEYRILEVLSRRKIPLIIPLAFPDKPEVKTPEDALNRTLEELRHAYLAPENPARLAAADIEFSLTADGIKRLRDFWPNMRRAVSRGLDPDIALAAITTNPAGLLGLENTHGTIEPGKAANFVVADQDLFESKGKILDVWVDGKRYRVNDDPVIDPRGEWELAYPGAKTKTILRVAGRPDKLSGTILVGENKIDLDPISFRAAPGRLRADFSGNKIGLTGAVRLSAVTSAGEMNGWAELPGGGRIEWTGTRVDSSKAEQKEKKDGKEEPASAKDENKKKEETEDPAEIKLADIRPAMEYGREAVPEQPEHVLVRNATVWTMGPEGILEGGDLLISRGKIAAVGRGLAVPSGAVKIIDAEGRHVTPGLIDAHLHAGITGGVNEVGSAIVPEVRIGDVLDSTNIWMYRQLAGGLTTAHVMHGSANPIGGQNQHIKLRWGAPVDELKFTRAPRTVKFALGENPKRRTTRYPNTRMGVEQIIADHFRAARDYQAKWREWEENREGIPPRRDLRLEALVDILEGEIFVHSHSYRQDEILMLLRLAESFNLRIKAFHHGVEAYKVAPELAEHGAGAIVWSDWSSFKIEAYDATTRNARLLTEAGVLTSLHSDNSQIASRMNWEAAKMVRAGMAEEDALALVTINTARLLGVDEYVGSLEPGKDADFVLWSGHPLSSATRAEQTWIDGRRYFDIEEDRKLRESVEQERSQLINYFLEN